MKSVALATSALCVAMVLSADSALALRANLSGNLKRLEDLGQYEEALFLRRSTMDMVLAVHVAWSGAPYDPAMDGLYHETRTDRRYWSLVDDQKRPVTAILEKANLTAAQQELLERRVRVYVEDHLSPDFDETGDFYFRRKAWCLERMGLFTDASYRRRLSGYYCQRVCAPYYSEAAEEFRRAGGQAEAAAYQAAAGRWQQESQREFRRCNGDRVLAGLRTGDGRKPLPAAQVLAVLTAALKSTDADARFAAAGVLLDLDELKAVAALASDGDADIRQVAAGAAARLEPAPAGLGRGLLARYYSQPDRPPAAQKVLPAADIGLTGNERFPDLLRPAWVKPTVLPADAKGEFRVVFLGRLLIPADGQYRCYVKTDRDNRATVKLAGKTIISPRENDKLLRYSWQTGGPGVVLARVDFSEPQELKQGPVDLEIDYRGAQASGPQGPAGLRLYWSSQRGVMSPVPPEACFHVPEAKDRP